MRRGESQAGRFPHCKTWDHWASGKPDNRDSPPCDCATCTAQDGVRERGEGPAANTTGDGVAAGPSGGL
jgi:hypothetical protein